MKSPAGKWTVIPAEVGGNVKLTVQNRDGETVDEIETEAPDNMMWASGWMNDEVFVLASQKIGNAAWKVGEDGKFSEVGASLEMIAAGERFFLEKHPFD